MKTNRYLALAIVVIATLTLLAAVMWPLTEQRNAAIDRAIEGDFFALRSEVEDYYESNRRLPDTISDLELSEDQQDRAAAYNYSLDKETATQYALCANFRTDTRTDSAGSDDTYLRFAPSQEHAAGYDCISYEVYSYFYDEPASVDSFFDFGEEPLELDSFESFESDFQEL